MLLASVICATAAAPLAAVAQDTVEPPSDTVWSTSILTSSNLNLFDTPQIMQALYHPHSDLVLLSAHRGFHALAGSSQVPGVPENSLQSIGYAAEAGWEMIELDVKLTSDGVPILSHDKTWGRQWCGLGSVFLPGSASPYDPFTPPGSTINDGKNPGVNGTTLSNTRSFLGNTVLRDSVSLLNPFTNHGCNGYNNTFGEYPPTLADALDYITKNKIRMVVMLDIQGLDIAQAALNVVLGKSDDAGRPFLNSVIFKMPMSVFPHGTSDFLNTFGNSFASINFIPVINTADVAPTTTTITDTEDGGFDLTDVGNTGFGGESGILNSLQHFETDALQAPNGTVGLISIPAVEVNIKEPGGILTQTVLPAAKLNLETQLPMTVGTFNPVGEYYPNGPTAEPQFFRSSNGSCCDYLEQYLYNNPNGTGPLDSNQPMDRSDQRRDLNFLTSQGFQYLITDDPTTAHHLLQQQGKRNLCYLEPTPLPNCSSGGIGPVTDLGPGFPGEIEPLETGSTGVLLANPTQSPAQELIALQPAQSFTQQTAYYDSWSVYQNAFYLKNLDTQGVASKLTTLIYSFENIDPVNLTCLAANQAAGTDPNSPTNYDGASDAYADYQMGFTSANSVDGSTDQWGQALEGNFNQLRELKAKYPNVKVLLSIGGWTYSKFFSDVAATQASRQKFVSSCINLYLNGNLPVLSTSPAGGNGAAAGIFDGFDIDWEYPASANGNVGNHYSPADTANYTALLAEFRSELNALGGSNKHYMLTAAVPAGPSDIANIQVSQIAQYLDFADVMAYDFHGAFETTGPTNYQAPLYDTPASTAYGTGFTADAAITNWLNGGFPANQLVMGIPTYARGWTGVPTGSTNGLYQSVTGATAFFQYSQEAGVADYKELEAAGELNNIYYDPVTESTYAYDGTNFYGTETPWSIGWKKLYAQQKGLAGMFLYSLEDDDSTSTLVNATFGPLQ
ncbi:glycoside hydrolase family 18 protein [Edaphobacter modestus]|uniref:glycoside hydrolase family 18 protein n=1 Tax=Edaphobacter modestus TaxID=388466 RepID=UPI0013EE81CC|nr:glycoside hydrolase family 18 protein [Edaphobacter modestus]